MVDFILKTETIRRNALNALLDAPLGMVFTIREKLKTTPQRSFFHLLIGYIAKEYGEPKERVKHLIKEKVLGRDEWTDRKGNAQSRVISSEELGVDDYNKLIDYALIVADHLNITIPPKPYFGLE